MHAFLRLCCSFLLVFQANAVSWATGFGQQSGALQTAGHAVLEDGTPVKMRFSQTVSSAEAHLDDRVEFEVLEEVRVSDTVVIPKGGIAWGTVTEAEPKRRMARGGKLEIVMDSVRLVDGEKAALRATKEAKGGGHTGAMTAGIVATGLILWPVAPFFLFMHGKDISIPKGTEFPTFIHGNFPLELARFQQTAPGLAQPLQTGTNASVAIASIPAGAEIFVDENFVGNAPSSIAVPPGKHLISVRKQGYRDWERALAVSGGTVSLNAELEPGSNVAAAASVASKNNPPQQMNLAVSPGPGTVIPARVDAESSSGWIGIATRDDEVGAVVISKLVTNGQAEKAGLRVGDVISELNGTPIKSGQQFDIAIAHSKPGSQVEVTYVRGESKSQVLVTVGKIGL